MFSYIFGQSNKNLDVKNTDYIDLINNTPIEELKAMHHEKPICTSCNEIPQLVAMVNKATFDLTDLDKFKFLIEDLKLKANLDICLDIAIEKGNIEYTKYLINKGCKYSKYAKQMAIVNKNFITALYADSYGIERNNTNIKVVHKILDKNKEMHWMDCISNEFRF